MSIGATPVAGRARRGSAPSSARDVLYGISFDGLAISGVVNEFVKLALSFHLEGYEVHFDLGFDIKPDKGNFFRPYPDGGGLLPGWVRLARTDGLSKVSGYDSETVAGLLESGPEALRDPRGGRSRLGPIVRAIADRLVQTWKSLEVTFLIVENATIPENLLFTRALYRAIERYGRSRRLGRFVLWRDHDLPWLCEPEKYARCLALAPRPRRSWHILYSTLTEEARTLLEGWAPGVRVHVLPNSFDFSRPRPARDDPAFRRHFGIPQGAPLIVRCSRLIPQKRIDRELHLVAGLNRRLAALGHAERVFLLITGRVDEDPAEFERLRAASMALGIARQVVFADGLASPVPGDDSFARPPGGPGFSVDDALAQADLSSFLTSYDYEGFGNPPGEACAARRPYLTSSYEVYQSAYGSKGFRSLVLPVSRRGEDLPQPDYVDAVLSLLLDEGRRRADAEFNFELGRRHLSSESLGRKLSTLFPGALRGLA